MYPLQNPQASAGGTQTPAVGTTSACVNGVGGILTVRRADQRRPRYQKPPPPSSNTTTMIMIRRVKVSMAPLLLPPGTSLDGGTLREREKYTDESAPTIAPLLAMTARETDQRAGEAWLTRHGEA